RAPLYAEIWAFSTGGRRKTGDFYLQPSRKALARFGPPSLIERSNISVVSTHVSKNETWGTRCYLGHPPGINIPWVGATQLGNTPRFSSISPNDVQPGNIVQFVTPGGTHMGIETSTGSSWNF